jgi:hypothetical protein
MPRVSPIITSFNSGEWSPRLYGRVDLEKYPNACRTCKNFVPLVHGPAERRPGTYFIGETKTPADRVRLFPFEFNVAQAYILEFGDEYMRVYKDGALVVDDSGDPYELATPYAVADLPKIKYVQDADTLYLVHPDYPPQKLTRADHDDWTIAPIVFLDGPYRDENVYDDVGGNLCTDGDCEENTGWASVGTPTTQARSNEQAYHGAYSRKFTIDADGEGVKTTAFTTVTGKLYRVRVRVYTATQNFKISIRKGDDSGYNATKSISSVPYNDWTEYEYFWQEAAGGTGAYVAFTNATGSSGTWYIDLVEIYEIETPALLTPSGRTGTITLTATAATFEEAHEGSFWRIKCGEDWGYVEITEYTTSTSVTATVKTELAGTDPTPFWREGAFSVKRGYPAAITFNDQALWLAGTASEPLMLWRSVVGDYENFAPGDTAADGQTYRLKAEKVNSIRWLASTETMTIGTVSGAWTIGPKNTSEALRADNARVAAQTPDGSADIQAVNFLSSVLYVQRLGKPTNYGERVLSMQYDLLNDRYKSRDVSILAEHIADGGIVEWAYMASPYPIVWMVRDDGALLSMTYSPEQEVIAWALHDTDGVIESCAVIPGESQDDLYLSVKRTINGSAVRYIEMMVPFDFGDQEDAFFVDCGLSYEGAPETVLSGLDHLAGETVSILADGATVPDQVVTSDGAITLDTAASVIHVGLPYVSDLSPMDLEGGAAEGTAQGKKKRIHEAVIRFHRTAQGKIGPDADRLDAIIFRDTETPIGEPAPLYSGDIMQPFRGGHAATGRILIRQDKPLPMTILNIMPRFTTEDR